MSDSQKLDSSDYKKLQELIAAKKILDCGEQVYVDATVVKAYNSKFIQK